MVGTPKADCRRLEGAGVKPEDLVLVPGDVSWAMKLDAVQEDLDCLGTLPGTILLVKGNHDLWWKSISQLRQRLPENVFALQNDFYPLPEGLAVCGTRGWKSPGAADFTSEDEKVYLQELARLRLSLKAAQERGYQPYIVMLHYHSQCGKPNRIGVYRGSWRKRGSNTASTATFHGHAQRQALTGTHRGISYYLVACDAIDFKPLYITSLPD